MELALILWLCCGVICYFIAKSKNYPKNECLKHAALGFLLGFIWLIVMFFKKDYVGNDNDGQQRGSSVVQEHLLDSNQSESVVDSIGKLAELKEKGLITEDEFNSKKEELLKRI